MKCKECFENLKPNKQGLVFCTKCYLKTLVETKIKSYKEERRTNTMMKRYKKSVPKRCHIGPLVIRTYIPFMQGRPKRDKRIIKDDVTNLKILLNTCQSFEKLLSAM